MLRLRHVELALVFRRDRRDRARRVQWITRGCAGTGAFGSVDKYLVSFDRFIASEYR